jgi:preprotein translocase subunit SecD
MRYNGFAARLLLFTLFLCAVLLGSHSSMAQARRSPTFEIRDLAGSSSAVKHMLKDREGDRIYVGDTVFFSRADMKSVEAVRNPEGEGGVLNVTWKSTCVERWKEYTGSRVGHRIAIIANGTVLATPKIIDRIEHPGIMVSLPNMDMQQAQKMARELSPKKR